MTAGCALNSPLAAKADVNTGGGLTLLDVLMVAAVIALTAIVALIARGVARS